MNYLYDILLNFNLNLYEVYEWNKNDEIIHIRKIPFFKVTSEVLLNIINNKIKIDSEFLTKVYKKTERFNKNKINTLNYCFIVTDGKEVVAIKSDGNITTGYSKLLYEEESEALEYSQNIEIIDFKYKILSKNRINAFHTRNENNIKKYILKTIDNIIKDNDYDKLNYIYLECFSKKINDDVKKRIYIDLEEKWDEVYLKIYDFLRKISLKY